MPVLLLRSGEPLKDAAGNQLKTGQTVTDEVYGDGIVRGTISLDRRGEGLNVLIDWLGPTDATKPKSRSAEFLTAKFASGGANSGAGDSGALRVVQAHTGAQFESGGRRLPSCASVTTPSSSGWQ